MMPLVTALQLVKGEGPMVVTLLPGCAMRIVSPVALQPRRIVAQLLPPRARSRPPGQEWTEDEMRIPRPIAFAAAAMLLAAEAGSAVAAEPSGTVTISQVQIAFLVSGNVGGGTLRFKGRSYDFSLGGLGYGGVGASKIEATGEVYNLNRVEDFEGAYVQGRYGAVAGKEQLGGDFWLYNTKGVELRLRSRREGYALSLGGDAVYIKLD